MPHFTDACSIPEVKCELGRLGGGRGGKKLTELLNSFKNSDKESFYFSPHLLFVSSGYCLSVRFMCIFLLIKYTKDFKIS